MKYFLLSINIIYINILIIPIKSSTKIPLSKKIRIHACMTLQEKKFGTNENILTEFIQNRSYIYPDHPNKIILLAMAYCYNKMTDDLANYINKVNINKLDINRNDINELYNFENYDYNDTQMNEKIYNRFIPVFNSVYKEMTNKENYQEFWNNYQFYFTKTKLWKFFVFYIFINIIIVFYLRIKNRNKFIDKSDNNNDEDEDEDIIENKESESNINDKNKHRKLKKKKGLTKNKND